jgi:allophanate hydrolase subunit 2
MRGRTARQSIGGQSRIRGDARITLIGPSLTFAETALIALCGADLSPRIGERPLPPAGRCC